MSAPERKAIGKKLRFDVFKRDSFTCQYCGAKAPDVVLQVDHIEAVANGGDNHILNLITSCMDCNGGKGARPLSDQSTLDKQRQQLEELQERRNQIEMMMQWRQEAIQLDRDTAQAVSDHIRQISGYGLNEAGIADVRKWLKKHTLQQVLDAADESFDQYLRFNGDEVDVRSWGVAFGKIPLIIRSREKHGPYAGRYFYIQAILRNRFNDASIDVIEEIKEAHAAGVDLDAIQGLAKEAGALEEFSSILAADARNAEYTAAMREQWEREERKRAEREHPEQAAVHELYKLAAEVSNYDGEAARRLVREARRRDGEELPDGSEDDGV